MTVFGMVLFPMGLPGRGRKGGALSCPPAMPRKSPTYRPFEGLRRNVAPESAPTAKKPDEPLASTRAVRLPERTRRVPPPAPAPVTAVPSPPAPAFALTRTDGRVEGARKGLAARERRTLRGTPTATCDLHGQSSAGAQETLRAFLKAEHRRGRTLVLVIVGRGRHSPAKRPVLRREVVDWLTEAPLAALVLAFYTAPRDLGGEGAIIVRLTGGRA
jgi:DNA-nicking Smr family endonuclease